MDVKKSQGGSITNFNPSFPPKFTDQFTIEAMRQLGIVECDIVYPSEATLNLYSHDNEIRKIARRDKVNQVDHLISQIKERRNKLINDENEKKKKKKRND